MLSTVALALGCAALPAFAAQRTISNDRPLAVSVPAEPAQLAPGARGTVPIRVVNPGVTPIVVRISGRHVGFGDDGRVTITGRDPVWDGRVDFPPEALTVPAQGYRNVKLTVRMPARISPDLYFVGFVVTPVPDASRSLTYVNQVGSYLTIDVPGPRVRSLSANLQLPGFAFTGGAVHGELQIRNVGHAAATFWMETDTTATPGSASRARQRYDRSLLPAGRTRTLAVVAKPSFPIAFATVHVHIYYPGRTDASTKELVLSRRVLVVQPVAILVAGALLVAAAVWWCRRRRKRRPTNGRIRKPYVRSAPSSKRKRRSRRRVPVGVSATARVDRALAALQVDTQRPRRT